MYGTLTEWRAYASERGDNAPTDASNESATAALVRASDHIKFGYVANFSAGYDETVEAVEYATYEAALFELATPGFFSKTYTPDQQKVLTQVDKIKWSMKDASGDLERDMAAPVSTRVDAMLKPYMQRRMQVSIGVLGT